MLYMWLLTSVIFYGSLMFFIVLYKQLSTKLNFMTITWPPWTKFIYLTLWMTNTVVQFQKWLIFKGVFWDRRQIFCFKPTNKFKEVNIILKHWDHCNNNIQVSDLITLTFLHSLCLSKQEYFIKLKNNLSSWCLKVYKVWRLTNMFGVYFISKKRTRKGGHGEFSKIVDRCFVKSSKFSL